MSDPSTPSTPVVTDAPIPNPGDLKTPTLSSDAPRPPQHPLKDDDISRMSADEQTEYWKREARKYQDRYQEKSPWIQELKDKAKRLDDIEEANKSELQKAADRAAAAEKLAADRAAETAVLKAAVKHKLSEDDLDLLGTHGTPEEIEARAEKLAARLGVADTAKKTKPDMGGGDRGKDIGSDKKPQLTKEDVSKLTAEKKYSEIEAARADGRLDDLLSGKST